MTPTITFTNLARQDAAIMSRLAYLELQCAPVFRNLATRGVLAKVREGGL